MNPGDPTLASDAERSDVVALLQQAHVAGRLDSTEVAERIEGALRSRTRGELADLLADLPEGAAAAGVVPVPQPDLPARRHAGGGLVAEWAKWGSASATTFVIWLIIYLTTGGAAAYPWFLWVAGPWGAVLLVRTIASGFTGER